MDGQIYNPQGGQLERWRRDGYKEGFGPGTNKQFVQWDANGVPQAHTLAVADIANPYKFRAHRSAATQAVGTGAFTVVQFDVEDFDTNNNYDNATNFNYTVPVSGFYLVSAQVGINAIADPAGTAYILSIFKGGAEVVRGGRQDIEIVGVSPAIGLGVSMLLQLTATNTVDIRMFQNSGGNRNVNAGATVLECHFSMFMVSAT